MLLGVIVNINRLRSVTFAARIVSLQAHIRKFTFFSSILKISPILFCLSCIYMDIQSGAAISASRKITRLQFNPRRTPEGSEGLTWPHLSPKAAATRVKCACIVAGVPGPFTRILPWQSGSPRRQLWLIVTWPRTAQRPLRVPSPAKSTRVLWVYRFYRIWSDAKIQMCSFRLQMTTSSDSPASDTFAVGRQLTWIVTSTRALNDTPRDEPNPTGLTYLLHSETESEGKTPNSIH